MQGPGVRDAVSGVCAARGLPGMAPGLALTGCACGGRVRLCVPQCPSAGLGVSSTLGRISYCGRGQPEGSRR